VACGALLTATAPGGALARFTGVRAASPSAFRGITFSPAVAPVVASQRVRPYVQLTWAAVTVSNGATVRYRVMRKPPFGSPVEVCTGASTPSTSGGIVTCMATEVGASAMDTYTEQPYVQYLGVMTWSLPASSPA